MDREQLQKHWQQGCQFLGTRYAILGGAMSWLSEHRLVSAISNAGGFGVLAAGNLPTEILKEEIQKTKALTNKPFGVNLITLHPKLPELIRITLDEQVSHVVLAGGIPSPKSMAMIKEGGAKVIVFAPALALAKRLISRGADALVVEGSEAGGHIGPVSTSILMQEITPHITQTPVFVAGGIGSGDMVANWISMGASGCQLGTRFVCTEECIAHENFKKIFLRANARDAAVTAQFDPVLPVIPVRALVNEGVKAFNALQMQLVQEIKEGKKNRKEATLELEHFWVGALRRAAIEGDVEHGSVMAGQSVGLIKKIEPVEEVIQSLITPIETLLKD
ncbi:NAD(P)H-dependent flavin oxidoreductase [Magnetococcales bacterium HHB-1]